MVKKAKIIVSPAGMLKGGPTWAREGLGLKAIAPKVGETYEL